MKKLLIAVACLLTGVQAHAQFSAEATQYPTTDYSASAYEFQLSAIASTLETDAATLSEAIDAKDKYTQGHSGRVAAYAKEIARQFESLLEGTQEQEGIADAGATAPGATAGNASGTVNPAGGQSLDAGLPGDAQPGRIDAAGAVSEPAISPTDLYSLQFHAAMLRFTAESGSQVQRQASQGLESLLRNQS